MNKTENHLIYIGMPVFNGEQTIRAALESIVAQDYLEWKLLISDNCSSDKTLDICNEFALRDSRIKVIQQSENIGGWRNFLFVFSSSEGSFFKFQACDDILSQDFLRVNMEALQRDKSLVGSSSPDCWDWEFRKGLNPINFEIKGSQRNRIRILRHNCWRSHGMFFGIYRRKELAEVISKEMFASKIAILDWLILAGLAKAGNINRSPDGLIILGSNGASNSRDLAWFNQLTGFRAKLFPYLKVYYFLKKFPGKLFLGSAIESFFWIIQLQLNHMKGLLRLLIGNRNVKS